MRLLLSTAAAALLLVASAHAQRNEARIPRRPVATLEAAPPAPISFGAAQCVLQQFTAAQGWLPVRHPRVFADVNGDDKDDIVGFADDGVYVSVSNGAGFAAARRWIEDFGYNSGWRQDIHERTLADVNNDNRADVVGFGNEGVYVALSNGSNFGPTARWAEDFGAQQGWLKLGPVTIQEGDSTAYVGAHHIRMTADVDGNGRADIVGFGNDGVYYALSTGTRFTATRLALADLGFQQGWRVYQPSFGPGSGPILSNRIRTMADVNGDRRADIVAFGEDGVYVALAQGLSFGPLQRKLTVFDGNDHWGSTHLRALADFNGDGRADIIGIERSSGAVAFGAANGGLTLAPFLIVNGFGTNSGWTSPATHPRLLSDLNGDGRADFVGFGDDGVWTSLSQGAAPMTSPVFTIAAFGRNDANWRTPDMRFTPDLNGDGRVDIAGFGNDCVWTALSQTRAELEAIDRPSSRRD